MHIWVGEDALFNILLRVEVHIVVLVLEEGSHDLLVGGILLLTGLHHLLHLALLDL